MSDTEENGHDSDVSLEVLRTVDLVSGCSEDTLVDLRERMHKKTYARGAYIVAEGDVPQEMFFIVKGQVEYVDKKYQVFNTGKAGECFGEIGLLYTIPRTAHVRAATDVELLLLKKTDFDELRANNEVFNKKIETLAIKRFNRFKYEVMKLSFVPEGQSFTDAQLQSFREAFYRYTENTGQIDRAGLKRMITDLSGKEFSDSEVTALHKSFDKDSDGVISFNDFVHKIHQVKWLLDPKEAQKIADKIQREMEVEENKKALFPDFDGPSFGLGIVVGSVVAAALAIVASKFLPKSA